MKLNLGCGYNLIKGWENIDKTVMTTEHVVKIDLKDFPWPYETESVDAIMSQHFLQEFQWRDLVKVLAECYRVLKPGGVFRLGVPDATVNRPLDKLLGWGNVVLFDEVLLTSVLKKIGFNNFKRIEFKKTGSAFPEITSIDDREDETLYMEAYK